MSYGTTLAPLIACYDYSLSLFFVFSDRRLSGSPLFAKQLRTDELLLQAYLKFMAETEELLFEAPTTSTGPLDTLSMCLGTCLCP